MSPTEPFLPTTSINLHFRLRELLKKFVILRNSRPNSVVRGRLVLLDEAVHRKAQAEVEP